jgi:hypothetical protein
MRKSWVKVVAFDRSPCKLFSLRFSKKLVQAPSGGRPKTTQRTRLEAIEYSRRVVWDGGDRVEEGGWAGGDRVEEVGLAGGDRVEEGDRLEVIRRVVEEGGKLEVIE